MSTSQVVQTKETVPHPTGAGGTVTRWHVTVLSNFARGYDKYSRRYSKEGIAESTFPERFFVLREEELAAGVRKAGGLLRKLRLAGDRLVALRTEVAVEELRENTRTGIGQFVERGWILLSGVAWLDGGDVGKQEEEKHGHEQHSAAVGGGFPLRPVLVEEVMADSLRVLHGTLGAFESLRPRSFSVLPIARGCQASCPFCFSEASASAEQDQARLNVSRVAEMAGRAAARGAERFVITGGGEPGLLRHELMRELIAAGSTALGKTVLITNGHHLARKEESVRAAMLEDYARAGLEVLAVSRHHHDDAVSTRLMSLETDVAAIARTWAEGWRSGDEADARSFAADHEIGDPEDDGTMTAGQSGHGARRWPGLRMRLICVLQRGGVADMRTLEDYASWAAGIGIAEICFKELYVSTSAESVYHRHAANAWSQEHQVPLSLVLEFAARHGFEETSRLPWGSPVFAGEWRGRRMKIAAYTEPSLFWERAHGLARSWNLMADGRCLVSLEDRSSDISAELEPAHAA